MDYKELLQNERRNFELLHAAVTSLGGIPAMITPTDMSNTIPNEKVGISLHIILAHFELQLFLSLPYIQFDFIKYFIEVFINMIF